MGFLTPLYLAGLAAVAAPILFHMIRRTPKGRMPFSTLMFLEPSPPRVTRRSAIEHWLLLLIRAAAVILLAIAFSRPFLRSENEQILAARGCRTGILLDVSASMRREGLWKAAVAEVQKTLDAAGDNDTFALFLFDRELIRLVSFEEWKGLDDQARNAFLKEQLADLEPGWQGTDLGRVLPEAVTAVLDREVNDETPQTTELVVISDLQTGSRLAGLQAFDWPDSLAIDIRQVTNGTLENAGLQIFGSAEGQNDLRVRIDNSIDSVSTAFQISVVPDEGFPAPVSEADTDTPAPLESGQTAADSGPADIQLATHEQSADSLTLSAQVPPGQNRVVRVSEADLPGRAMCLTLTGDREHFDNTAWFVRPDPVRVTIEYFGEGASDDPDELRYYAERAFLPTSAREIDFVAASDGPVFAAARAALTIVARPLEADQLKTLQADVRAGRQVVVIGETPEICGQAFEIAERPVPEVIEATVENYAMLSDIDFEHPLFAAFNDIRLGDFSKLPIWRHREVRTDEEHGKVLARFDSGSPAILEMENRQGSVTLFTFGWHAADSRFVLWSKFVPVINGLLERVAGTAPLPSRLTVGEAISLSMSAETGKFQVTEPSGFERDIENDGDSVPKLVTSEPGIYQVSWETDSGPHKRLFAANLDPLESQTSPLGRDELAAIGIPLAEAGGDAATSEEKRQLRSRELEASQSAWQWLILAGLLLLLLETWLAGRTTGAALAAETVTAGEDSG